MNTATKALLENMIDYAGLFPPSRLPLTEAVGNFAEYRRGGEAWMLRHFVISVNQLPALAEEMINLVGPPWSLAVVGPQVEMVSNWDAALGGYLADMSEFQRQHGDTASIAVLELALPAELVACHVDHAQVDHLLRELHERIGASDVAPDHVFVEAPAGPASDALRRSVAGTFAVMKSDTTTYGLKLRTGGLDAAAFPSTDQLSAVIRLCQKKGVAWKATAGLHRALPRQASDCYATMHGFLNLLAASTLALADDLDTASIRAILSEHDPARFILDDAGLRWRGYSASAAQIEQARRRFVSFGSCSFDQPRADLCELGIQLTEREHV